MSLSPLSTSISISQLVNQPDSTHGMSPEIAAATDSPTDKRILEAAENFESLFLTLLLKEMRNTLDKTDGGLFGGSDSSDTYGGMFDQFMGQTLAEGRHIGIADAVERYLNNKSSEVNAQFEALNEVQNQSNQPQLPTLDL